MTDRIVYLDVIRITAMLLVVACHCFGDITNVSPALVSLLTYIEMPCIGLFIAISGALILPVKTSTDLFLKKRLKKIIVPAIIWSFILLAIRNKLTLCNILGICFYPAGSGILWFIYTIIGLYLISPVISPWLERAPQKLIQLYLLLWAFTLCFPIIGNWIHTDMSQGGWAYYCSGYLGYYVLGFYLHKYGVRLRVATIFYAVLLCIMVAVKIWYPQIVLYNNLWYLSIFGAGGVLFYWVILKYISDRFTHVNWVKPIALISNLTFGIYFIHIILVTNITPEINLPSFNYLLVYVARVAFTFICALLISWILSFLPFANYLIGFRQKK